MTLLKESEVNNVKEFDKVAILILFFNKIEETMECINSFLPSGKSIYVFNNGSEEILYEKLQKKYEIKKQVHFISSDENMGPSKGRNILIRNTTEDWLFFVDNDITIKDTKSWVAIFNQYILANPHVQIICPRLFNVHENEFSDHPEFVFEREKVLLQYSKKEITNYFPSGASIVRRDIFNEHGNFEENIFAFEDYEYAIRMLCKPGVKLQAHQLKQITLIHNHRFQKKKLDKKAVLERYNEKRLSENFAFIENKHGVTFDHDWKWWSQKQVSDMTQYKWLFKLKLFIKKLAG